MSADWKLTTLKEAGVALIDCDHKTPAAQTEGLPYVGIPQVKDGRITLDGVRLISPEDFIHWRRKAKPSPNDVILSRRCNPGETAYVPDGLEIALGQNLVLLRSSGTHIYPPLLRWLARGPFWWEQVNKFINVGAVFNSLKCADIPNFEILLPPLETQIKIAKTLNDLDKKIELNTQTNQTLESIAQAIFKSWFVDFEPVKAKMAAIEALTPTLSQREREQKVLLAAMGAISGKNEIELAQMQQENPDDYSQLAETAALFPSAMVESELGEIPEGWEVKFLKELTSEIKRGISPKYSEELGTLVINQKCIRNHKIDFSLCRLNDSEKKSIKGRELKAGDVLINSTGVGTLGRLSPIRYLPEPCTFDSHVTLVRSNESLMTPQFLAGFLLENETFIESSGAGSTGQTELNRQVIEEMRLSYPGKKIMSCYEVTTAPISKKIAFLENESKTLSELRDSLLPKLLSGEIDLSESALTLALSQGERELEGANV